MGKILIFSSTPGMSIIRFSGFENKEEKGHRWSLGCISDNKLNTVKPPPLLYPFVEDFF